MNLVFYYEEIVVEFNTGESQRPGKIFNKKARFPSRDFIY